MAAVGVTSDWPARDGAFVLGYRTAPMGAVLLCFCQWGARACARKREGGRQADFAFLFRPTGMSMRCPVCAREFNICLCNRSEKSKCPSQGPPRGAACTPRCMPDGSNRRQRASLTSRNEPRHEWLNVNMHSRVITCADIAALTLLSGHKTPNRILLAPSC